MKPSKGFSYEGLTKIMVGAMLGISCYKCPTYMRLGIALGTVALLLVCQLVFGISSLWEFSPWRFNPRNVAAPGAENGSARPRYVDAANSSAARHKDAVAVVVSSCSSENPLNASSRLVCTLQRILANMTGEVGYLRDEDVLRLERVLVESLSALWIASSSSSSTGRAEAALGLVGGSEAVVQKKKMLTEKVKYETPNVDRFIALGTSRQTHQKSTLWSSLCPDGRSLLLGPRPANLSVQNPIHLEKLFSFMSMGGSYSPPDCQAEQKTAVIIPYRNRWDHLHVLLHNLVPFLVRQMIAFTIFVIELALPTDFNRALLLNVGVLESLKLDNYTCFIFHDVDLIPLDERNLYQCGAYPRHLAVAINKFQFSLPYEGYFGGVAAMSREQLEKVNGNSNLYFGWGGEDDDMYFRIKSRGMLVARYPQTIGRYEMISHDRDTGNSDNNKRWDLLKSATSRMHTDGLNSAHYRVEQVAFKTLYTWMTVSVNMTEVLEGRGV